MKSSHLRAALCASFLALFLWVGCGGDGADSEPTAATEAAPEHASEAEAPPPPDRELETAAEDAPEPQAESDGADTPDGEAPEGEGGEEEPAPEVDQRG